MTLDTAARETVAETLKPGRGTAHRNKRFSRGVAADPDTLRVLHFIHGNPARPFQTLSFFNGTERHTHSDVVHFDTLPQRGMMAAAWLALEDVHPTAGPLHYYPGSQALGLWDYSQLGLEKRWLSRGNFSRRDPEYQVRLVCALH